MDHLALNVLWAKSDRDGGSPVSLIDHARGAGRAAEALLDGPLSAVVPPLAAGLGVSNREAIAVATGLIALHDIGKASPAFQGKWETGAAACRAAGLKFGSGVDAPHAFVSSYVLADLLQRCHGWPQIVAKRLARAVGAHHGRFPPSRLPVADDDAVWADVRDRLAASVVADLCAAPLPTPTRADDAAVAIVAGLTTFADWLASDRDVLGEPVAGGIAAEQVTAALERVPLVLHPRTAFRRFDELFPFAPRGAQLIVDLEVIARIAAGEQLLVVIEDATGAGKTEAAFAIVHAALSAGSRGAYVALPTRATSNQAYSRLVVFLAGSLAGTAQAHLLHAGAMMTADYAAIRDGRHALSPRQVEEGTGSVDAAAWFGRSKRGLLSQFAVGTIDQAMLAVLQSRFATLRLVGLAGKTLVLDEVHAYDTYMLSVIERLVAWAASLGVSIVLLSATLPIEMKRKLAIAFGATPGGDPSAYPSVTIAARGVPMVVRPVSVPTGAGREVGIERVPLGRDDDVGPACVGVVAPAVAAGAEVAVILNTVRRAQTVYSALVAVLGRERVALVHARFRQRERDPRERAVVERYGRDGSRPGGSVVVATQVIEQSLDVDFDYLVTDIAPVDLLLQRAGRLQRHERPGRRPAGYDDRSCRLALLDPPVVEGVPTPDAGTLRVYHPHVLLRTWIALRDHRAIVVPDDVRALVEAVYDDRGAPPALASALRAEWEATGGRLAASLAREEGLAANRLVGRPGDERIEFDLSESVGHDDAPSPGSLAQTRLGVSCPVVVLTAVEAASAAAIKPGSHAGATFLLERSLSIAHPALARTLLATPPPAEWRAVPLVSRHRRIVLDSDGRGTVGAAELSLHPDLGLIIEWSAGR